MQLPDLYSEFEFRTSRSGGKGGQHVNKTESKVELVFNPGASEILSQEQKDLLTERWANKLDSEGYFHLTEEGDRSQIRNKEEVISRFYRLMATAFRPVKKRKPTKVPRSVKLKRMEGKKQRSEIKSGRKKPDW